MATSSFLRSALLISSGPLFWAAHFLLVYSFTGIVCARPGMQREWLGINILTGGIVMAAAVALTGMLAFHLLAWRRRGDSADNAFIHQIAALLALLSGIAIAWETLPILLVPAC